MSTFFLLYLMYMNQNQMIKLYLIIAFLFCSILSFAQTSEIKLSENWKFKSFDDSISWHPTKIPSTIHTDLYDNKLIPHPFVGNNELDLQWISDKSWVYQCEFHLTNEQLRNENIDLIFEGLDTYAKVFLNDELILEANNAFRTWKKEVKKILKKKNKLRIEFVPTKEIEEQKKSEIPYELPEGNRIFTRKAQFQYGWDWGPKFNTMGIWRPVYLEFWNETKIDDIYIKQLNLSNEKADLEAEITLNFNSHKSSIIAEIYVNNSLFRSEELLLNDSKKNQSINFSIHQPKRWWTHNLGEPYLYEFKVRIKDLEGNLLDEKIIKKGLRTIELVTDKDELGEKFFFKLNGEHVYMKGANYIPQNPFQNWVKNEDYDNLLDDVLDSNMNMLRIWGGGIYEDDLFYELCDEKGILVWQDFMFACAMYPGDEEFLENVRQEAIDNVKRLRNHSSIALWCGNNESAEGWHRWGWQEGKSDAQKEEIWGNYQRLFNGILPEVVAKLTDFPYWETSPKFGRGDDRYISEGDAHDWWIWHDGHPFENLEQKTPRFMSEFGFQSFPSFEAIRFINDGKSTSISSKEFQTHQKHSRGFEIIKNYMERDFPVPTNEEDYVYVSQLLQAYGIGKGIEAQRRNKPYTMGSLYWQLNDCWPVVSWSGMDSFGNWKALQYQAKHSFEDVLISFQKTSSNQLNVFLINDILKPIEGNLIVELVDFEGNVLKSWNKKVEVAGNRNQIVWQMDVTEWMDAANQLYILAKFNDAQSVYYLVKPKDLNLPKGHVDIQLEKFQKGYKIRLDSKILQKNLMLSTEISGKFSDNYFDLLPNQAKFIEFQTDSEKFDSNDIKIYSLNQLIQK